MCEKGFLCMSVFYHSGLLFWMSFCCMILLKKKNRMEGGREGRREGVWWKIWDSRIYKFYFLSCFFVFSFSSFLFYLYFFAIIFLFFFKMFLYHCNSLAPVLPICICLFGLCGRNLSSSHLSLKKKKKEKKINNNRMYRVLYPGNLVLLSAIHIMRL